MLLIDLWRSALNANLSWHKMARGTSVEWIGAKIAVDHVATTVTVSLPTKKLVQLRKAVEDIMKEARGMAKSEAVRALAGLGGW